MRSILDIFTELKELRTEREQLAGLLSDTITSENCLLEELHEMFELLAEGGELNEIDALLREIM